MIVRCERCETRFKLDESRLPARGARVRCSRCKHAFFVTPPGAAKEELVHQVAAEAARAPAEKPRPPEPSWDLEEGSDATIARRKAAGATARAPAGASEDENTDWRFEDDVPGLEPGATRASFDLSGSQTAPSLAAPPDPDEDSLAELGDPSTWDLLAGETPPADAADPTPSALAEPAPELEAPAAPTQPPARVEVAPSAPRVELEEEPAPAPPPRARIAPPAARTAFAPPAVVVPRRIPVASGHRPATSWAGWAGLAVLVAAIAWGSLRPSAPAAAAAKLAPVAGFEVAEARARIVDNAAAGPILVISGRLRNPGPSARALGAALQVQLLDVEGAPLGEASAPVGPALSAARVREEAPEALRSAQQAAAATLATAPVAAGSELEFSAVFAPAPHEARRFALTAASPAR